MFTVIMQGHPEAFFARDAEHLIDYIMDFSREHGGYSGMEDWEEETTREWLRRDLERALEEERKPIFQFYIPYDGGWELTAWEDRTLPIE